MFCVTTTFHKFVFSLVTNEKPNEWRPLFIKQILSHVKIQTHVFNEIYNVCFPRVVVVNVKALCLRCAGRLRSPE